MCWHWFPACVSSICWRRASKLLGPSKRTPGPLFFVAVTLSALVPLMGGTQRPTFLRLCRSSWCSPPIWNFPQAWAWVYSDLLTVQFSAKPNMCSLWVTCVAVLDVRPLPEAAQRHERDKSLTCDCTWTCWLFSFAQNPTCLACESLVSQFLMLAPPPLPPPPTWNCPKAFVWLYYNYYYYYYYYYYYCYY